MTMRPGECGTCGAGVFRDYHLEWCDDQRQRNGSVPGNRSMFDRHRSAFEPPVDSMPGRVYPSGMATDDKRRNRTAAKREIEAVVSALLARDHDGFHTVMAPHEESERLYIMAGAEIITTIVRGVAANLAVEPTVAWTDHMARINDERSERGL